MNWPTNVIKDLGHGATTGITVALMLLARSLWLPDVPLWLTFLVGVLGGGLLFELVIADKGGLRSSDSLHDVATYQWPWVAYFIMLRDPVSFVAFTFTQVFWQLAWWKRDREDKR